ncbi:Nif11-like leader peptide family natural product precursor [Synechococcus sp. MIT S9508]|uniref:Nif11-like leader peptide family natural product precursor n=1 Tax=Synechococcus sp. MIT S9508 TaxID=1801629 RepID=UPI001E41FF1B|nr:Nif11-like leader peptide family natural product precursor [Synechococcus sp. MIT S9508]
MRQAATPMHLVNMAKEKGLVLTQATMMKMQAEKMKHLHDDHINDASTWGEALLICFGEHS